MAKTTARHVRSLKGERPIVCVTAYDAPGAAIADAAQVDVILVGDSVGNTVLGMRDTVGVTLDQMLYHTAAVRRGCENALLVADMPFGSYQASVDEAVRSAVALAKAGAEAVKLEGPYEQQIAAIVRAGLPVMGHVGMTPQSVNAFGGFRVQGREAEEAERILADARVVEEAGAFAVVLELIPIDLARRATRELAIPTIGIGAGPGCDGQIQVFHDLVGLGEGHFRHAKRYVEGRELFVAALRAYADEVRAGTFPTEEHGF
jgi:3-methyl-2-oxobutanoate hydroxymethyltransferase